MAQTHVAAPPMRRSHDVVWAWIAAAVFPVLLAVGFWLGMAWVGDPNEPTTPHGWDGAWRVIALWATMEIVPCLGILWGIRAVRRKDAGSRGALTANAVVFAFFVFATLLGGLLDAFD